LIGLAAGHLLGGPDPGDRTVLALATCTRHPGIAMAIAALNFPEQKTAVMAMGLLHMIIGGIVAIPYTVWSKRSHAAISVAAKP
jgi:bile acid:Na+ symporter, BASS family